MPGLAKELGSGFLIKLIGEGGKKQILQLELEKLAVKNVEIHPPIKRAELIEEYSKSDYLLIHLNDYDAFKKVLPSKVFELATYDKPILAGVGGFAAQFIKDNVSNSFVFNPCDFQSLSNYLKNSTYKCEIRSDFIKKYNRNSINLEMVKSIESVL